MRSVNLKTNDIFLKGFEFFEQKRYEDALKAFKASARARPEDADVRYSLGLMCLLTGDRDAALIEYEILKSLNSPLAEKLGDFISPHQQFSLKV
jgi:tetratricopeptide (TPR) repeat protein